MMTPTFALMIDGKAYRPKIHFLHRRFFYGEGDNLHTHPEYHFILISAGQCEFLQANRPPIRCPRNTLIAINPDFPHTFRTEMLRGVEHSCVIFALADAEGNLCTRPLQSFFNVDSAKGYFIETLTEAEAESFFQQRLLAADLRNSGNEFAADAALCELLTMGMRLSLKTEFQLEPRTGRQEKLAAAVRTIVEEKLNENALSLGKIAKQLQLHPNYLNKIFTESEKRPIGEFILHRRLLRAQQLLVSTRRIKDVAGLCGFSTQNYFTRIFRQRFGCTPSEYRAAPPRKKPHEG